MQVRSLLYKINFAEVMDVGVGEFECFAEESVRTAPDAVDLVKRGAQKIAAGGEKQIEVSRLANAEGNKHNADEYPKILEWVKTKTDVTEESAQIALAIKILNKKY